VAEGVINMNDGMEFEGWDAHLQLAADNIYNTSEAGRGPVYGARY